MKFSESIMRAYVRKSSQRVKLIFCEILEPQINIRQIIEWSDQMNLFCIYKQKIFSNYHFYLNSDNDQYLAY